MTYPKEAVVFEIIASSVSYFHHMAGDHIEGGGACCLGTDREWQCGVLVSNGAPSEEDEYHWVQNLRPLTPAAEEMKALFRVRK